MKKELALSNDISYYIQLDCRESNKDYIRNSIITRNVVNTTSSYSSKFGTNECLKFIHK